jgi:hypothetical protein
MVRCRFAAGELSANERFSMKGVFVFGLSFFASLAVLVGAPPVPVVSVSPSLNSCPGYYCDPHGTTHWVIASDGIFATVVLDASASFDPDGDALTFLWARVDDGDQFFGSTARTTNTWFQGEFIRLYVSDGTSTSTYFFHLELITPLGVVENLMDAIDELEIDEGVRFRGRSSLDAMLTRAGQHLQDGEIAQSVDLLERFQKRIASQSALIGAVYAQDLIQTSQAIIDALE